MDTPQPIFPAASACVWHLGQQLLPGAVLGPTVEPLVDRVPLPEPLRHVPPRRPGAVLPRHAFYSEPVIRPRPRTPGHRRHQRFHHGPHIVRDLLARHRSRLTWPETKALEEHGPP